MPPPITRKEFAARVKQKYPAYKDIDDSVLVEKMVTKYPEYKAQISDYEVVAPAEKKNLLPTISEDGGVGVVPTKSISQSSAEPATVTLDVADVQAGNPTPDINSKSNVNDFYTKSVADIDPNFAQYQKSLEVLPKETNMEVAKEIATNKSAYEDFANRVVARYDTNTDSYIKRDNQPIKEGDIIAGIPGEGRNKFFEIKNGVPQPVTSPNPLFNYGEQNDATVFGFVNQDDSVTEKIKKGSLYRDAGAIGRAIDPSDEYVDDKNPELSGYIVDNYKFEGGKTLKPFLDKNPEVAAELKKEIAQSPSKGLTPEGHQELLSNAVAKAYKLDVEDYDVKNHPETNREKLITSMEFLNDKKVRETMTQLEKEQKKASGKIEELKTKIEAEQDPAKKEALIADAKKIQDDYNAVLEKNKTTIKGYEDASSFLEAPQQAWVKPMLEKQEKGSAILSNAHRFFPTSARQEKEAFDMEHGDGDNSAIYLLKKFGSGAVSGAGALGTLFDKVVNRPFMSDEDRQLATKADASGARDLRSNLYTNESGRGELLKTAGGVASILGYTALGGEAAPAMVFADTYQNSLQEANRQGLGGVGAQVNAGINALVMSNLAHMIPNFSKAGGTFKVSAPTLEKIMQGATTKEGVELLKSDIKKYIIDNLGKNASAGVKTQAEFAALGAATAFENNVTNQLAGTDLNDEVDLSHSMKDALGMTILNSIIGVGKGALLHKNIKNPEVRKQFIDQAIKDDPSIAYKALDNLVEMNKGDADVADFVRETKKEVEKLSGVKPAAPEAVVEEISKPIELDPNLPEGYEAPKKEAETIVIETPKLPSIETKTTEVPVASKEKEPSTTGVSEVVEGTSKEPMSENEARKIELELKAKREALTDAENKELSSLREEPPIEPPKDAPEVTTSGDNKEGIGLAHADTEAKRKEFELEDRIKWESQTDEQRNAAADEIIKSGKLPKIIEAMKSPDFIPTGAEHFAMVKYAAELNKRVTDAMGKNDFDAVNKAQKEYDDLAKLVERKGSEMGESFQARKAKLVQDDSLSRFMSDMKADAMVDELTPEQMQEAAKRHKEVTDTKNEAQIKIDELEAANKKLAEDLEFERAKKDVQRQKAGRSKPKTKEQHEEKRAAIKRDIKELWANAGKPKTTSIDGKEVEISEKGLIPRIEQLKAIAPKVKELLYDYLEQGKATTLEGVRKLLRQDLAEAKIDVTEEEVRAYIAGEYNAKKQTRSDIAKQLFEIKQEEKLLLELEALQRGEKPKTLQERIDRNAKLKAIRDKINDLKNADSKEVKRLQRLADLQEELNRVTERRQKEKAEKGEPEEKELSEEEREIQDKIDEENRKWGEERDATRRSKNDYKKIETERNRQLEKVEKLKEKLATLESGKLPDAQAKGDTKKDTPEIEALKQEIEVAEKAVRESMAHQKKMEGLEAELDRVKNRQEKEKEPKKKSEMLADEKAIRAEIEAEQAAWATEKNIEKLTTELQRVKDRKEKATTPKERKELSDTEKDLMRQIKDEKEVWAKEKEPALKLAQAEKSARKSINDLKDKIANNDLEIKEAEKSQSPTLDKLREEQKQLREELEKKRKDAKSGRYSDDNQFISAAKARIKANNKRKAALEEKLRKGDFAPDAEKQSKLQKVELQKRHKDLYNEVVKSTNEMYEAELAYSKARISDQMKNWSAGKRLRRYADIALTSSKGLVATFDQSPVLVQALMFTGAHPLRGALYAGKALYDIFKSDRFNKAMYDLHNSSDWDTIEKSGLAVFEPRSAKAELRSELHGGEKNILNKVITINGKKYSIGRSFERSTATYLNNARLYLFNKQVEVLKRNGQTIDNNPEAYERAARTANELTGQGKVMKAAAGKDASETLNKIIWSPKMFASSMNLLGIGDIAAAIGKEKGFYRSMTGREKLFVAEEVGRFLGMAAVTMGAAAAMGFDVDLDPRSSGFGSIKVGDYTWNVFGRYGSVMRTVTQAALGERVRKDGTTDVIGDKYGEKEVEDVVIGSFLRGKMTPLAGALYDKLLKGGKNYYTGEQMSWGDMALSQVIPMSVNSIPDFIKNDPNIKGIAASIGSVYGASIRNEKIIEKQKAEIKAQEVKDSYTKEDLNNPELKFLRDKGVKRPTIDEKNDIDVDVDEKHPDGKMTNDEYKKFVTEKQKIFNEKVKLLREASDLPVFDENGSVTYKKGKDLTDAELEPEIKFLNQLATKKAKEKIGFGKKEETDTERELSSEKKAFRKIYNEE